MKTLNKAMVKVDLYTVKENKKGQFTLPEDFIGKPNMNLISHAIRVYEHRKHPHLAKVKTRSETASSTRKIYRQKGTGGARHGAKSAPIFVGGGIAHGPKGFGRKLTLSDKQRKNALKNALALKVKSNKLVVIEGLENIKKTKEAQNMLNNIKKLGEITKKEVRLTFVLSNANISKQRVLRNIKNVFIENVSKINVYNIFYGGVIILDKGIFVEGKDIRSDKKGQDESKQAKLSPKKPIKSEKLPKSNKSSGKSKKIVNKKD